MVNVKLKLLPGERPPLSKAPWSAVTVWVIESLLVQVTLVPIFTVSVAGLKAKFIIVTLLPLLEGVVVVAVVGVLVGAVVGVLVGVAVGVFVGAVVGIGVDVVVVPPPQPARKRSRPAASRHSPTCVVKNAWVFCMIFPLLHCYKIDIGERFFSPSGRTSPSYILRSPVQVARSICRYAIAIHRAPGPL